MLCVTDFTVEQIANFLAVVDHGSFSQAARAMNKAQSAVSLSVQKLEQALGVTLFDRAGYKPVLTMEGRALLPQARLIAERLASFRLQAQGIAGDVETELRLAIDELCPANSLPHAMTSLHSRYPRLLVRSYSSKLDDGMALLLAGKVDVAVLPLYVDTPRLLERFPLATARLFLVASPEHPLARIDGTLSSALLGQYLQLVMVDGSGLSGARDYGVFSGLTWRFDRTGDMLPLLLNGCGYGILPEHLIADDLAQGRLVPLTPANWEGSDDHIPITFCAFWRADRALGPAAQWLLDQLRRPDTR